MALSRSVQFNRVTSAAHPAVRLARQLVSPHGRRKTGLVTVEGVRAAEAAVSAGAKVTAVLLQSGAVERAVLLARRLADSLIPVHEVPGALLRKVSLVAEPQGIVLICAPPSAGLEGVLERGFVLVADGLKDPGNLGSLVRSARAFGVDALVTTRGTTSVFGPKALRATAGAWPGLMIAEDADPRRLAEDLVAGGFRIVVGDSSGSRDYTEPVWRGRIALVLGSEAHGTTDAWRGTGAIRVRIPLDKSVESLNVSAAAAVLLAEAARQRER